MLTVEEVKVYFFYHGDKSREIQLCSERSVAALEKWHKEYRVERDGKAHQAMGLKSAGQMHR